MIEDIYAGPHECVRAQSVSAPYVPRRSHGRTGLHRRADRRHGHLAPLQGVPRRLLEEPGRLPAFPIASSGSRRRPRSIPTWTLTRVGIYGGSAGGQSSTAGPAGPRRFLQGGRLPTAAATTTAWTRSGGTNCGWAGRSDPHYEEQSNVTQAHRLQGKLLLIVGETGPQRRSGLDHAGRRRAGQSRQGLRPAGHPRHRPRCGRDAVRKPPSGRLSSCGICWESNRDGSREANRRISGGQTQSLTFE